MSRVKTYSNMSNLAPQDFQRFVSNLFDNLFEQINGKLDFQENIRSSPLQTVVFTGSSDIHEITHNLGFVPHGIIPIKLSANAVIYAPSGSQYTWTSTNIFLQSSAAVTASLYII